MYRTPNLFLDVPSRARKEWQCQNFLTEIGHDMSNMSATTVAEYSGVEVDSLVDQIKADHLEGVDLGTIDVEYQEIAGFTPDQLQSFLEEKVGMSEEEGVQGTIGSLVVTPATHC